MVSIDTYRLAQVVWDRTLRHIMPRQYKVYNGVAVPCGRIGDVRVTDTNYKTYSVGPLREFVQPDDRVVVVGGGLGVTAVVAGRHGQSVVVYEPGGDRVDMVRRVARINQAHNVEVRRAVVGEAYDVYGDASGVDVVHPSDLPKCDILEMDAEGAELPIMQNLTQTPRVIIVEIHPHQIDEDAVLDALAARDYRIRRQNRQERTGNLTVVATHHG